MVRACPVRAPVRGGQWWVRQAVLVEFPIPIHMNFTIDTIGMPRALNFLVPGWCTAGLGTNQLSTSTTRCSHHRDDREPGLGTLHPKLKFS